MGNEFGHPEWIDFPREGNGWSFHYCRRQWSLKDSDLLKYRWLSDFDEDMVRLAKESNIFDMRFGDLRLLEKDKQTIVFYRNGLLFAFNFNGENSLTDVKVPVPAKADYTVEMCSDDEKYGGWDRVAHQTYPVKAEDGEYYVELYLPAHTAIVLKEGKKARRAPTKKTAEKKAPAKKPAAEKKSAAQKTSEKKPAAKKPAAKRSSAKKAEE